LPGFRRNCRKPLALLQLSPSKTGILVYRSKRGNWDLIAHDRVLPPKHRHVVVGSDVLFLKLALERGMTIAAVAGSWAVMKTRYGRKRKSCDVGPDVVATRNPPGAPV
jgi:hypothetical protein